MAHEAIVLYRQLMRAAKGFSNYNFREYALRHVRDDFRQAAALRGEEAERAMAKGREELVSLRRMAAVSQLYPQVSEHQALRKLAARCPL
eukprot:scaffold109702_cov31-Tisochrysis_lutea.AAC.2